MLLFGKCYYITLITLLSIVQIKSCNSVQNQKDNFGFEIDGFHMGWATETKGGENGTILRVTNLNTSGPGSLIEAIEHNGPRIIVFEISGIIDFKGRAPKIINPYITIAGQTAPEGGVTIINGGIRIATHNVIIQHIRIRPGDTKNANSIDGLSTMNGASNIIIDHCSFSWAIDENLSASGPRFMGKTPSEWRKNTSHNITFSNNIIGEGLYRSRHTDSVPHSMGTLIHDNVTNILIIGNLYTCNNRRNPMFKGGTSGAVINNLIYNPGEMAITYRLSEKEWKDKEIQFGNLDIIGNVMQEGPSTNTKIFKSMYPKVNIYLEDNLSIKLDGDKVMNDYDLNKTTPAADKTNWNPNIHPLNSKSVSDYVLKNAGATPWNRDKVDERIITNVLKNTGKIINSEQETGGLPSQKAVRKKFQPSEWSLRRKLVKRQDTLN